MCTHCGSLQCSSVSFQIGFYLLVMSSFIIVNHISLLPFPVEFNWNFQVNEYNHEKWRLPLVLSYLLCFVICVTRCIHKITLMDCWMTKNIYILVVNDVISGICYNCTVKCARIASCQQYETDSDQWITICVFLFIYLSLKRIKSILKSLLKDTSFELNWIMTTKRSNKNQR